MRTAAFVLGSLLVTGGMCLAADPLARADFQKGVVGGWLFMGGKWATGPDTEAPPNRVLTVSGPGTAEFGSPTWTAVRATGRVRLAAEQRTFGVRIGVRSTAAGVYVLEVADTGLRLCRRQGAERTVLATAGEFRTEPGRWYLWEVESRGTKITARLWPEGADSATVPALAATDEAFREGRLRLEVDAATGVWFDDILVVPADAGP